MAEDVFIEPIQDARIETYSLSGSPSALGRHAIAAELLRVSALLNGDVLAGLEPSPYLLKGVRKDVRDTLKATDDPSEVSALIEVDRMPVWLREQVVVNGADAIPATLSDKRALGNRVLVNVLQWHNWQLSKKQAAFEQEELPGLRQEYTARLAKAIEDGWMPPVVMNRIDRLSTVPTYVDDGFHSIRHSVSGSTNGDRILLSPLDDERPHTYTHEATHLLSGKDETQIKLRYVNVSRSPYGLERIFRTRYKIDAHRIDMGATILDEALTERITTGLMTGDIDTRQDPDDMLTYGDGQILLNFLCHNGVVPVDIRLFVNVYCEDGTERDRLGKDSAAAQLVTALETAFPRLDIMYKLSYLKDKPKQILRLVRKLEREGEKGPLSASEARRYHRNRRPIGSY